MIPNAPRGIDRTLLAWLSQVFLSSQPPIIPMRPGIFDNLPATPATGQIVVVTDSMTGTWGATVTGGGAIPVIAWFNGTNWTVVGA